MIKRGTPDNIDDYIAIDDEDIILGLARLGYYGFYIDGDYVYYKKNEELELIFRK